jgi:hypothetical protein
MRHVSLLSLVVSAVVIAAGCNSKRSSEAAAAPAAPAPAASPAAAPPAATASATSPAPAAGEIGVAECDDYLRKWESCLASKVTGEAREQVRVALDATRDGWKRSAAIPEAKAGLAAACKEAAELAAMQVSAYGCTW